MAFVWRVVGGHNWKDGASQALIRFERWRMRSLDDYDPDNYDSDEAWRSIRAEAERRGMAAAWLLHNDVERLAGLVSIAEPSEPVDLGNPKAGLHSLETSPSLGTFEERLWTKEFDRTSWVLTIWLPIEEGAALWPNSPPMPAPAYAVAAG